MIKHSIQTNVMDTCIFGVLSIEVNAGNEIKLFDVDSINRMVYFVNDRNEIHGRSLDQTIENPDTEKLAVGRGNITGNGVCTISFALYRLHYIACTISFALYIITYSIRKKINSYAVNQVQNYSLNGWNVTKRVSKTITIACTVTLCWTVSTYSTPFTINY